jgi:hypothetical protein
MASSQRSPEPHCHPPNRETSYRDVPGHYHLDDLDAEVAQVALMREKRIDSYEIHKHCLRGYEVHKRYLRKDGEIVWGRKTVGCVGQSGRVDRLFRNCD